MAECFKTRIENLEKSIPPSVLSRNKKKDPRKGKPLPTKIQRMKSHSKRYKVKDFVSTTSREDILRMTTGHLKH